MSCYATVRQVSPKRAAGGGCGVVRGACFVVFFGRGEVTSTVSLVGPSPESGRTLFRDEIMLSTAPCGAFARDRIGRLFRGRRRPQNLARRDTEVCPSPSVTCRCHTPAPSPVPRPTTKSSSVDCTGENFRDRTPPRTVNTRRPAGTDHPRRADTATPAQRRMPHRHTPTRRPRKAVRTPTGQGPTGRVVGVVSSRPAVRPPTAAAPTGRIVGVTAAAKLADCLASVTTDGTQPVRLFVRRHGHSPRHTHR